MPKRTDIHSILIVGAGPIVIGQACEFDYSGTQACKALRAEGYKTILINSNPATIMTDPSTADRVYIEPITPEVVEKIIVKEQPDAILPTVGGQTALNCCLALHNQGILQKYGVEMIGAKPDAIDKAENRRRFNEAMANIGLEVARNAVVHTLEEAMEELPRIGLPAIIRPSFTLGGTGGGIARAEEEYKEIVALGLRLSPTQEVLIDESVLGWKEYEMEVIRDKADNVIIICSIENIDPMGVHTGDSITVAPAQTLTDKEYQRMRDASIAVLREIGVETGGSNVQFAVDPDTGRMIVIEMNPRVSRSSALASKATGFPIAKIAAKLAAGFTLDELKNDITQTTPASFEPSIDYVVTKIPRFTFEKFTGTQPVLSTAMHSVGEAMSIGRNFAESLQKGLRSLETGLIGLDAIDIPGIRDDMDQQGRQQLIRTELLKLSPNRILVIGEALRAGMSVAEICEITHFDRWFVEHLQDIVAAETLIKRQGMPQDKYQWLQLKKLGFSDKKITELTGLSELEVYKERHGLGVRPVYKMIDTCAAEFASFTPYMYSTYEGDGITEAECEAEPSERNKVVILGSGPNRIGQGIEFDYSCTHAAFALEAAGYETIMVNCNPETVSTDYDTSDRLYFEPLTTEDVVEILHTEQQKGKLIGVIVTLGGQTPLKLAHHISDLGFPIIGTSTDSLDLAGDRERFKHLLDRLNLVQPMNDTCSSLKDIAATIDNLGYPVVIRPSNVLGGRAMAILRDPQDLADYLDHNSQFIVEGAILVDKFLGQATEIDVDALADGEQVYIAGIMEHIEHAGVHSGDSTCSIPTRTLTDAMLEEIRESTIKLAEALSIKGLINIQYAIQDQQLYVIEVNPRASRTVPFVAKATGVPIASIASRIMLDEKLEQFDLPKTLPRHFSVKEVVFPFSRFKDVDIKLRPEMQSTGEVMGTDPVFELAFYKAQLAAGYDLASVSHIYIDGHAKHTAPVKALIERFAEHGYKISLETSLHQALSPFDSQVIALDYEQALNQIKSRDINLVIDIDAQGTEAKAVRRQAYAYKVCHTTTLEMVHCMLNTMIYLKQKPRIEVNVLEGL